MNLLKLLTEDIYGAVATVYHRCQDLDTLGYLYNHEWKSGEAVGNLYGKGIYTCFELTKAGTKNHKPAWNNPGLYGDYLIKGKVERLDQFFIFDPGLYCKIHHKAECGDYIGEQNKRFGTHVLGDRHSIAELGIRNVAAFATKYKLESRRCRGMIFLGSSDGPVLFAFNPYDFKPIKAMYDPSGNISGKWEKVETLLSDEEGDSKELKKTLRKYSNHQEELPDEMDRDNPKNFAKRDHEGLQYEKDGWELYRIRNNDIGMAAIEEIIGHNLFGSEKQNWFKNILANLTSKREEIKEGTRTAYVIINRDIRKLFLVGFAMGRSMDEFEIFNEKKESVDIRDLKKAIPMQIFNKIYDHNNHKNLSQILKKSEETYSDKEREDEKEYNRLEKRNSDAYDKAQEEIKNKFEETLDKRKNRRVTNPKQNFLEYISDKSNYGEKKVIDGVAVYTMKNFTEEIMNLNTDWKNSNKKDALDSIGLNPKNAYLTKDLRTLDGRRLGDGQYQERIKALLKGQTPEKFRYDKEASEFYLTKIEKDKQSAYDFLKNPNLYTKKRIETIGYKTPAKLYEKDGEKVFIYYNKKNTVRARTASKNNSARNISALVYKNGYWNDTFYVSQSGDVGLDRMNPKIAEVVKKDLFGKHIERYNLKRQEQESKANKPLNSYQLKILKEIKDWIPTIDADHSPIREIKVIYSNVDKRYHVSWITENGNHGSIHKYNNGFEVRGVNYTGTVGNGKTIQDKHIVNLLNYLLRG